MKKGLRKKKNGCFRQIEKQLFIHIMDGKVIEMNKRGNWTEKYEKRKRMDK
jgi:hypothetical protein